MKKLVIGSRGSQLALAQSQLILSLLRQENSNCEFEIKIIKTKGDLLQNQDLAPPPGKGIFTGEFETALLRNEIDLVVHSLKDLPVESHPDLVLASIPKREDARDVLISREPKPWREFLNGATIATGSPRRKAQLLRQRPDFKIVPIRGNVDTRLKKLKNNLDWSGTILAQAGLNRLQLDLSDLSLQSLDFETMLPAPGQGALAIQTRKEDSEVMRLVFAFHDTATAAEVTAERALLAGLGGGCDWPIAAYGKVEGENLHLRAVAWIKNETTPREGSYLGKMEEAEKVGYALAQKLLS